MKPLTNSLIYLLSALSLLIPILLGVELLGNQKEFRNSNIEGYRHPYYWVAFQLSGDWRPIDF